MEDTFSPEEMAHYAASTDRALERRRRRGTPVASVIDIGASDGRWSDVAMRHYPDAEYLLIEAQECHRRRLEAFCSVRHNANFVLAAAGDRRGEIYFDDSQPLQGLASHVPTEQAKKLLPMTTIDAEVAERGLKPPYLIKLDTNGFEVPILEGAAETMREASLLVIEAYVFQVTPTSLTFDRLCLWLRERGFGVMDLSEPLWRPCDASLWQIDLFFVPLTAPLFENHRYE